MRLVFGLGNPGNRYAHTRHNVGFTVLDRVARNFFIEVVREKFHSLWDEARLDDDRVMFIKPQTYMNRSGLAVREWVGFFKVALEDILIVHDDLDMDPGKMKFTRGGGSGGHRGAESIIRELGAESIPRLKIGIGRPRFGEPIEEFVLKPFYPDQSQDLQEVISKAAMAVETWLKEGISKAMNLYN